MNFAYSWRQVTPACYWQEACHGEKTKIIWKWNSYWSYSIGISAYKDDQHNVLACGNAQHITCYENHRLIEVFSLKFLQLWHSFEIALSITYKTLSTCVYITCEMPLNKLCLWISSNNCFPLSLNKVWTTWKAFNQPSRQLFRHFLGLHFFFLLPRKMNCSTSLCL